MLPCPFCGGKAQAEALSTVELYWYECEDCNGASGGAEDWHETWILGKQRRCSGST